MAVISLLFPTSGGIAKYTRTMEPRITHRPKMHEAPITERQTSSLGLRIYRFVYPFRYLSLRYPLSRFSQYSEFRLGIDESLATPRCCISLGYLLSRGAVMAFPGVCIITSTPCPGRFYDPHLYQYEFLRCWGFAILSTLPTLCGPWADTQVLIEHDHRYTF